MACKNANSSRKEQNNKRGKSPSFGFPGKLNAARNSAPESAPESVILRVARKAHDRECHPRQIWREGVDGTVTDFGGDER